MLRLFLVLSLALMLLGFVTVHPNGVAAQEERERVVEIYNQNKKLIGTGASISFSGLILTAKHVLEDQSESGSRSPNYLLKLLVRRHKSTVYEPVELLLVHSFMDVAILVNRKAEPIPPLPIGKLTGLGKKSVITIVGHRQGQQDDELYKVITAKIDEIDRHGHIILGRGVDKGTSGGPAIHDGRLIGVIRNSGIDRTTVVPIQGAWEYFQLMGVRLSEDGLAYESDDISKLASKATYYEEILMDIQMDVIWLAEMKPIRRKGVQTPFPDDVVLNVWYDKKLSTQPTFETLISLDVTPVFAGQIFKRLRAEQRKAFPHSDWLLADPGKVEFLNLGKDIEVLLKRRYGALGITRDDFRGFDIVARISTIQGKGKDYVRLPEDYKVCFSLRRNRDDKTFERGVHGVGFQCPQTETGQ